MLLHQDSLAVDTSDPVELLSAQSQDHRAGLYGTGHDVEQFVIKFVDAQLTSRPAEENIHWSSSTTTLSGIQLVAICVRDQRHRLTQDRPDVVRKSFESKYIEHSAVQLVVV